MRSSKENEFYGNYKRQYTKVLQTPEQGKDLNGVNYLSSYHSSSIERYTQVHATVAFFLMCWAFVDACMSCVDVLITYFYFLFSYFLS